MTKKMNVMVGCDPEAWLVVRETGEPLSAVGMVPGTKAAPHVIDKGMVQVDGMAIEFGIDPASTEDEFVGNIKTVLEQIKEMIPKTVDILFKPTMEFPEAIMAAQPEEALELGCEPDWNAYTLTPNPRPAAPKLMRSAGGHVHVGYDKDIDVDNRDFLKSCATLATNMDWHLGVPSLAWDQDKQRRTLYGNAGAFRPKPYGMEYRSLSNLWVAKEELQRFVFRNTLRAVDDSLKGIAHASHVKTFFQGAGAISVPAIIKENYYSIGEALFAGKEDVDV
jgi:hypothetical protein